MDSIYSSSEENIQVCFVYTYTKILEDPNVMARKCGMDIYNMYFV